MTSVLLIEGYFAVWAVIHSVLASITVKKAAQRLFGPSVCRYYRLFFVLFAVVSAIPLIVFLFTLPDKVLYTIPSPWRWVMNSLQLILFGFTAWTVVQTDGMDFLGIRQLREGPQKKHNKLQTDGFYGLVRHPMYLTSILIIWLTPFMSQNLLTIYLGMTLYFYLGSIHEERLLIREFGEHYKSYRKKVPRILPGKQLFNPE